MSNIRTFQKSLSDNIEQEDRRCSLCIVECKGQGSRQYVSLEANNEVIQGTLTFETTSLSANISHWCIPQQHKMFINIIISSSSSMIFSISRGSLTDPLRIRQSAFAISASFWCILPYPFYPVSTERGSDQVRQRICWNLDLIFRGLKGSKLRLCIAKAIETPLEQPHVHLWESLLTDNIRGTVSLPSLRVLDLVRFPDP